MEVETALVQGQVAIQADAEIIVQDGRGWYGRRGLRGNGELLQSRGLRGKALKEEQSEQQDQQRLFWHNVLFVLTVNYINNVHLNR